MNRSEQHVKSLVSSLPLFSSLSNDDREVLLKFLVCSSYKKGEVVLAREASAADLFIVTDGLISTSSEGSVRPGSSTGDFKPGDIFGELSLFACKPSLKTFKAAEDSEVVSISGDNIKEILENHPETAINLISALISDSIKKLRNTSSFLANVVEWGENASRRAITDEMTGIYNREFLDDAIENFFNISFSNNKPLSLFMLDIDNFRTINDTLGIETGDKIISSAVDVIKKYISRYGIIARYGGDEFCILLPEADSVIAKEIAENIRFEVESRDYSDFIKDSSLCVTVSIGISSYPDTASDLTAFKEKADASLYRAKKEGRNRVICLN